MDVKQIDEARAQEQLEAAKAELEQVEAGESTADRWQLEQRILHAENQLSRRRAARPADVGRVRVRVGGAAAVALSPCTSSPGEL